MRRSFIGITLAVISGAVLLAAEPRDLLAAIARVLRGVRRLLQSGAEVNAADEDHTTPLMHAVIESDVRLMKLLIEHGARVNARNALDSTALMYAATNLAKAQLLLDAGADVNVVGKRGATPLSVAVTAFGSTPVLKLLVANGARPEDRLMIAAAQKGDLEAMRFLLNIGVSAGGTDGATLFAAILARCDACARLLMEKGAPASGVRANGGGLLNETAKRAMPGLSQLLLDHGASIESKDREGFTLLMQAVLSMEAPEDRDRMVRWLLSKGVDPNATNDRGDTAYQLAARMGSPSTLNILVEAGAEKLTEDWPKPDGSVRTADAAVRKILPLLEKSGEAVFRSRGCVSCHNNSLPAMTVALARKKGFVVDEEQAAKELGFAVATDRPFLEPMRLGSTIGGGSDTLGYTLMGMAAAGYQANSLTDAHIHYLSVFQFPDGAWRTTSYRPPEEVRPVHHHGRCVACNQALPNPGPPS